MWDQGFGSGEGISEIFRITVYYLYYGVLLVLRCITCITVYYLYYGVLLVLLVLRCITCITVYYLYYLYYSQRQK